MSGRLTVLMLMIGFEDLSGSGRSLTFPGIFPAGHKSNVIPPSGGIGGWGWEKAADTRQSWRQMAGNRLGFVRVVIVEPVLVLMKLFVNRAL